MNALMKKKNLLAVLLLLTLLLSLCSCVSYEATVDIKANGGGTVTLCATMDEETFLFLEESGFDYTALPGDVKKREYKEDDITYVELSKSEKADDAEHMQRVLKFYTLIDDSENSQRIFESVTYEITEENKILFSGVLAPVGENMDITLKINMPTKIEYKFGNVSVNDKEATVRVAEGATKGTTFKVESAPITGAATMRTALIVGAAVLGSAAVATLVIIVVVKLKHKKKIDAEKEEAKGETAEEL